MLDFKYFLGIRTSHKYAEVSTATKLNNKKFKQ